MQATAALPKDLHRRGVHAPGRDRDGPVEVGIPGRRVWDRPRERARGATFLYIRTPISDYYIIYI